MTKWGARKTSGGFFVTTSVYQINQKLGPFHGSVLIGADAGRCGIHAPDIGLQPIHAEIQSTEDPHQYWVRPRTLRAEVWLYRAERWYPVEEPVLVQQGETICLRAAETVMCRIEYTATSGASTAAPRRAARTPMRPETKGALLGMGGIGLITLSAIGLWFTDATPAISFGNQQVERQERRVAPERKPEVREDNELLERDFVQNYSGDPRREMDRWAPITGINNYRSGRIHSKEQLREIVENYDIKRILNLAKDSMRDQSDAALRCGGMKNPCEPLWADELGLEFHSHYLTNKPPEDESWDEIVAILRRGDTLVHCTHGVDRTGAVVARWERLNHPKFTDDEIIDYTYSFGGQWQLSGDPNRYLRAWMLEPN